MRPNSDLLSSFLPTVILPRHGRWVRHGLGSGAQWAMTEQSAKSAFLPPSRASRFPWAKPGPFHCGTREDA